jgi:hypothetical protein
MHDTIYQSLIENIFNHPRATIAEEALLTLAENKDAQALAPNAPELAGKYKESINDPLDRECALSELYTCLHKAGAGYSPQEQEVMQSKHGIQYQPGGLTPLLFAKNFIQLDMVVADLGAGNGLQGLLLQLIAPHKQTIQIELSSQMIEAGKILQVALNIPKDKIKWIHTDIENASLKGIDIIYMHRPVKPSGAGNTLYRALAEKLTHPHTPHTILSIADCFAPFIKDTYTELHKNEYFSLLMKK